MRFVFDMKPSFLVFLAFSFAVAGCNEKDEVSVHSVAQEQYSEQATSNATLYLPGGGGLEFGIKPTVDEVKTDSRGIEYRSVVFEFSEPLADVYSSIDLVMTEQGYSGVESKNNRYNRFMSYKKGGKSVTVGFNEKVSGGLSRSSSASFWWRSEGVAR